MAIDIVLKMLAQGAGKVKADVQSVKTEVAALGTEAGKATTETDKIAPSLDVAAKSASKLHDNLTMMRNGGAILAGIGVAGLAIANHFTQASIEANTFNAAMDGILAGAGISDAADQIQDLGTKIASLQGGDDDAIAKSIAEAVASGRLMSLRQYGIVISKTGQQAITAAAGISQQAGATEALKQIMDAATPALEAMNASTLDSTKAAHAFDTRWGNIEETIGGGTGVIKAALYNNVLSPLLSIAEANPELTKTAGAFFSIGSAALTLGGSLLSVGSQFGLMLIAFPGLSAKATALFSAISLGSARSTAAIGSTAAATEVLALSNASATAATSMMGAAQFEQSAAANVVSISNTTAATSADVLAFSNTGAASSAGLLGMAESVAANNAVLQAAATDAASASTAGLAGMSVSAALAVASIGVAAGVTIYEVGRAVASHLGWIHTELSAVDELKLDWLQLGDAINGTNNVVNKASEISYDNQKKQIELEYAQNRAKGMSIDEAGKKRDAELLALENRLTKFDARADVGNSAGQIEHQKQIDQLQQQQEIQKQVTATPPAMPPMPALPQPQPAQAPQINAPRLDLASLPAADRINEQIEKEQERHDKAMAKLYAAAPQSKNPKTHAAELAKEQEQIEKETQKHNNIMAALQLKANAMPQPQAPQVNIAAPKQFDGMVSGGANEGLQNLLAAFNWQKQRNDFNQRMAVVNDGSDQPRNPFLHNVVAQSVNAFQQPQAYSTINNDGSVSNISGGNQGSLTIKPKTQVTQNAAGDYVLHIMPTDVVIPNDFARAVRSL